MPIPILLTLVTGTRGIGVGGGAGVDVGVGTAVFVAVGVGVNATVGAMVEVGLGDSIAAIPVVGWSLFLSALNEPPSPARPTRSSSATAIIGRSALLDRENLRCRRMVTPILQTKDLM